MVNFIFLRVKIVGKWGVCQFPCSLYTCITESYLLVNSCILHDDKLSLVSVETTHCNLSKDFRHKYFIC